MLVELKIANKLLRAKAYSDAMSLYENIQQKSIFYYDALKFNVDFCRKKIELEGGGRRENFNFKEFLNVSVNEKSSLLDIGDYANIKKSILEASADPKVLVSICLAISTSPFQIDLYKHLMRFVNLERSFIDSYEFRIEKFTCLDLLMMTSASSLWLKGRKILRDYAELNKITDPRVDYIYSHDPSAVDFDCSKIKNFRSKKTVGNSIGFGTILLNEQKFIYNNLYQHYDLCDQWVLVEGACLGYPERKVSKEGLSLDKTSELIKCFPDPDAKLLYVRHGWTEKGGEDAKSELRNQYLQNLNADILVVVDADEFYQGEDLVLGVQALFENNVTAVTLPQVHFWKSTVDFITGEYYDISHTRIYRIIPGMKYIRNHNFPEVQGKLLTEISHFKFKRTIDTSKENSCSYREPACYHMGFAKDFDDMKDKSDYYVNRGERTTRATTTKSRAGWFDGELPEKCKVRSWGGDIPSSLKGEL